MARLQISGDYITNYVRDLFWEEKRPYKECEDYILDMIDDAEIEEAKQIARDIIEGRKKFEGVNEFDLVDDSENIRYITDRVDSDEDTAEMLDTIIDDLNYHMSSYVDPYVIVPYINKDSQASYDQYNEHYKPVYNNRIKNYDEDGVYKIDGPCNLGTWLHSNPDIVYLAIKKAGGSPRTQRGRYKNAFWDAVYEIIKDNPKFQDEEFEERNKTYLTYKANKEKNIQIQKQNQSKPHELTSTQKENIKKANIIIKQAKEVLDEIKDHDDKTSIVKKEGLNSVISLANDIIKGCEKNSISSVRTLYDYDIFPDDYKEWEGLIAPNGNFYSCDFGGHNAKAYYLMKVWPEKFSKLNIDNIDKEVDIHNALDTLLDNGWCATRTDDNRNNYLNLPTGGKITKAQEKAIFDTMEKHNAKIDLSILGYDGIDRY
jgi:hypothetical protein